MAAKRSGKTPPPASSRRQTPKPSLMEAYTSAFNDDHLQTIVTKIRSITDDPEADVGQENLPLPKPLSPSAESSIPLGTTLGTPLGTPLGHRPIHESIHLPNVVPNEIPNEAPNDVPNEIPNDVPNGVPNEKPRVAPAESGLLQAVALNENQAILYYCIKRLRGRVTSLQQISQATGIAANTLKRCLHKLRKEKAILYHGRKNAAGRFGFTADALPCQIVLHGDQHLLRQRLEDINQERLSIARAVHADNMPLSTPHDRMIDPMTYLMTDPMTDPVTALLAPPCSSSKKLLQGFKTRGDLVLEGVFANLDPQSLLPHLGRIETTEELQDFLDKANACIAAAQNTDTPIKKPLGFLIAQLKAGYLNPPEGYKSRRVKAQEIRNRQLEAELEELRRLKEQEENLALEIFRAKLTAEEEQELQREAQARVEPGGLLSEEKQLEIARHEILRTWFKERRA